MSKVFSKLRTIFTYIVVFAAGALLATYEFHFREFLKPITAYQDIMFMHTPTEDPSAEDIYLGRIIINHLDEADLASLPPMEAATLISYLLQLVSEATIINGVPTIAVTVPFDVPTVCHVCAECTHRLAPHYDPRLIAPLLHELVEPQLREFNATESDGLLLAQNILTLSVEAPAAMQYGARAISIIGLQITAIATFTIWARTVGPRLRIDQMSDHTGTDFLPLLIAILAGVITLLL